MSDVPTSAPSMTAKAAEVRMRPRPTNEATMRQVAVLDCTTLVTAMPANIARTRLPTLWLMTCLSVSPNKRSTPVRTM